MDEAGALAPQKVSSGNLMAQKSIQNDALAATFWAKTDKLSFAHDQKNIFR